MKAVPCYRVDAFAERLFEGNPAAVCVLDRWLPDDVMQAIAAENNLSETAFLVPDQDVYQLRWMTPLTEVDLCGHATLASAFVVLTEIRPRATLVRFKTASGELRVEREGDTFWLDLPSRPPRPVPDEPRFLALGIGAQPEGTYVAEHVLMAVLASERAVRDVYPDYQALARIPGKSVIVTAKGTSADFVSRFFAPGLGIDEDPVTGAAHCTLTPYWARRLNKKRLSARQLSKRGGRLICEAHGDRVRLGGTAVLFSTGVLHL